MLKRADLLTVTISTSLLRAIGQMISFASGLAVATTFGATSATDSYFAALIVPAALANLVVNIMTNLFAPIYLDHIHRDPTQQQSILSSLSFVTSAALGGAAFISLAAVPISILLRGLYGSNILQAVIFGVSLVLLTPLVGLTRLESAICEAHQRYKLPALAALINPSAFVLILFLTAQRLGVYSLLYANLTGHLLEFVVLTIYMRRNLHISLRPSSRLHSAVRELLTQSIAPAITYGALFFVPTFDRAIAVTLAVGNLTAFHYGERIVTVLDIIIMGSVITVMSNHWAQQAAERKINAIIPSFNAVRSNLFFILIPLSLGGFLLRFPIFSIIFHYGQFTADGTSAQVFGFLLLSAPFNYLIVLIVRILLIERDVRAQMILAIGIAALNTYLNICLAPQFGAEGIALSTLLSRAIILALSYHSLKKHFAQLSVMRIIPNLTKTFICGAFMVAVLSLLQLFLSPALSRNEGLIPQIIALGLMITAGFCTYLLAAQLTRHPGLLALRQILMSRLSNSLSSSQV